VRSFGATLVLVLLLSAAAPASELPSEAVLADLPFASDEPYRVAVDLAPSGSERRFPLYLDTGASDSVLTPLLARQLGIGVRRHKSTPIRRPTVLGRDLQFWISDASSDTGSKTGWEYGLLGGRFLAEYVVEIDFQGRRVRFLDRKKYRVPEAVSEPGEAVLPMRVVGNRPVVDVELEGQRLRVLVDTGWPSTFVVSGAALRKADLAFDPILDVPGGGVLGPIAMFLAEARELRVGPFGFGTGVPVLVAPRGLYNQGTSTDSVLGYDLLAQFVLRLDYPRRRLWLRRQDGAPLTLFGVDYASARESGVLLVGSGRPRAHLIFPGSAAERRGIQPGDAIVSVEEDPAPDAASVVSAIAAGHAITVQRQVDGEWRQVALENEATGLPPVGAAPEE
jgi:hypothetical protein